MRILGFSRKWDKLKQAEFTTFRFARKDKDWQPGETVQIVYKPRSKTREILGTAFIFAKVPRAMCRYIGCTFPGVTNKEAKEDGFVDYYQMWEWLFDAHGSQRLRDKPMNKLTLRWLERRTG